MNRKGFFKTIFGSILAAAAMPAIAKPREDLTKKDLTESPKPLILNESGNIGLGTSCPTCPLVVSSLIFQIGERKMQMAGDEDGNFKINWIGTKDDESAASIIIQQPKADPWKKKSTLIS